jgi:hypothetical protein
VEVPIIAELRESVLRGAWDGVEKLLELIPREEIVDINVSSPPLSPVPATIYQNTATAVTRNSDKSIHKLTSFARI